MTPSIQAASDILSRSAIELSWEEIQLLLKLDENPEGEVRSDLFPDQLADELVKMGLVDIIDRFGQKSRDEARKLLDNFKTSATRSIANEEFESAQNFIVLANEQLKLVARYDNVYVLTNRAYQLVRNLSKQKFSF